MNGADTAQRLIAATQELLWERGYVGTSPRAIQQRAGAGQGSMYHHFGGKPDLARAAVRRNAEQLRALADAELGREGSAVERVRAYLGREREVLRGCRVGGLAQDPEVVADPELRAPLEETFAWLQERLAGVLEEGRANGEFGSGFDPAGTAAAIVAVVQGGYVLARSAGDPGPFHQAADGLLRLLDAHAAPAGTAAASGPHPGSASSSRSPSGPGTPSGPGSGPGTDPGSRADPASDSGTGSGPGIDHADAAL
ncbi:TetR/AcrR family transcriptional regulator [Streptomyces albus subsp. chlorinus]|nr:TetR/AcrR family transcriptional regulator [Streptomyces albus subsp. chlorinus]